MAMVEAAQAGRLLAPPFGAEGLKVDGAREAVDLLGAPPVGDVLGVVVLGNMDIANPQAADVLLKSIEEFDSSQVFPILWARDLGGVPATIRSRCLEKWSPSDTVVEEPLLEIAAQILDLSKKKDLASLILLLQSPELEKREHDLLAALARRLLQNDRHDLWVRLRGVASLHNPSIKDILSAFLGESK